jgi:hypothetical protein
MNIEIIGVCQERNIRSERELRVAKTERKGRKKQIQ